MMAISQGAAALMEARGLSGATDMGELVPGRDFDFTSWFCQIRLAVPDRWKEVFLVGDRFVEDRCVVMGHASSPQLAQRLSLAVVQFILHRFDEVFPAVLTKFSGRTRALVQAWQQARATVLRSIGRSGSSGSFGGTAGRHHLPGAHGSSGYMV